MFMDNKIDDAFNWLVLIMSTTNGALLSLVETIEMKRTVAGGLLPPFFVLILIWFLSYLIKRAHYKAILKTYAWFYASFMFLVLISIFADVFPAMWILKERIFFDFTPLIVLGLVSLFIAPFLFLIG